MVEQVVFLAADLLVGEGGSVKEAVAQLVEREIPVVLFGEGDRAELELIRVELGITAPFIVENGSAVFTAVDHNPFATALGEQDGNYYVFELGCPYVQARAGLRVLANVISHPLKGFGDFTVQQLERTLKLPEAAAHRAKAREFSEPFMTPKSVDLAVLKQSAEEMGFDVVLRDPEDSRFSFLRGADASLKAAVESVILAYQEQIADSSSLKVVGISARPDDLEALEAACATANWDSLLVESDGEDLSLLDAIASL